MKTFCTGALLFLFSFNITAQKYWVGSANDGQWNNAANWSGGSVPTSSDDVILDNTFVNSTYVVTLPASAITTTINTLQIIPSGANAITLIIPSGNTANPGLSVTGLGDAVIINSNGLLQNSTGVAAGGVGLSITNTFRINNNGKYYHNNVRGNATIVSQLSNAAGTEKGIFEYDVPTASSYTISLSNRMYGTLILSSAAAGGSKTYTGNGASDLIIKGNLIINSGANLSSTMTANINISGDATINGNFDNSPIVGTTNRSILFNGTSVQNISGSGNFTFGTNFRNIEISSGSTVNLHRGINLTNSSDLFIVNSNGTLQTGNNVISGSGIFQLNSNANLGIGSADGISATAALGNIQTAVRNFNSSANYEYNGSSAQITGDGLPSTVNQLKINNSNNVSLTNSTLVSSLLSLASGKLVTTSTQILTLDNTASVINSADIYGNTDEGNQSSFIDGPVNLNMNTAITKAAPVGSGSLFAPVRIQKINNGSVTYTVQYFPQKFSDVTTDTLPVDHVSKLEYWNIQSNINSTAADAKLILSWRPQSSIGNGVTADNAQGLSDLVIAHYFNDGGSTKWNMEGGGTATFNTVSVNGNSNLDYGTIGQNSNISSSFSTYPIFTLGTKSRFNALPLKLVDFLAVAKNISAKLSWITENENTIDKYIIERSEDGNRFNSIDSVLSLQRSMQWNYFFFDNTPLPGWNYYRLKIIDEGNKIYYSKIIKIFFGNKQFVIYPNPADKEIYFRLPSPGNISDIEIVNSSGSVVQHLQTTSSSVRINIEGLSKGIYLLYIRDQHQMISAKFIKR